MRYRRDHDLSTRKLSTWIGAAKIDRIARHIAGPSAPESRLLPLRAALHVVLDAYQGRRRKMGHPAAVHPCRVARRTRLLGVSTRWKLVAALGHDLHEDTLVQLPDLPVLSRAQMQACRRLIERLTRREHETYFAYMARVAQDPDALLIKVADRMDNTFDLRAQAEPAHGPPASVYAVLFRKAVLDLRDPTVAKRHPRRHPTPFRASRRLYDLFKTLVVLHFVRNTTGLPSRVHAAARKLATIACAEAQLTALHMLQFHYEPGMGAQAMLALASYGERFWHVTDSGRSPIDGLFHVFDARLTKRNNDALDALQLNPGRMLTAALSLLVVLLRFAEDPQFEGIVGLNENGLQAIGPPSPRRLSAVEAPNNRAVAGSRLRRTGLRTTGA